jgi:hypothetical protein
MMGFRSSTAMKRMLGFFACWAKRSTDKNTRMAEMINTGFRIMLLLFQNLI